MSTMTPPQQHADTTAMRAIRGPEPRKRGASRAFWYLFAAGIVLAVVGPVLLFFARAFENGGAAFTEVFDVPNIWSTFWTTIYLAAGSTIIGAVLAVGLAALALRVPSRLKAFARLLPMIPLVIPPVAFIYGWIFLFAPDVGYINTLLRSTPFFSGMNEGPFNVYTTAGIILIVAVDMAGMIFAFVFPRMQEINGSVNAAAQVAGASTARTFMTITFPLIRPGLVAGMVVAFLIAMGQFTAPLFLGRRENIRVISTEIFRLREQFPIDYPLIAVLGLPLLVFGVIAILIQRRVVGDQRRYITASTGRGITRRSSKLAAALVIGYAVVVVALPLLALTLVSFSPFWSGDLFNLSFTVRNFEVVLADPRVSQAIANSIWASFLAVLIVIPLGFVTAMAMSGVLKAPQSVTKVLDFVFIAPLAVPRAVLGVVVLFVFIRPPFSLYGTIALFVIGYVFIALPFALRSQHSSLIGVDKSLFEASRVAGASQWQMIRTVALPVARKGIAAALALAFVMLTNDFAVSVMVQSPGQQVMGTLLYLFEQEAAAPSIAVLSLIMSAITAAILAITLRIGGKAALESL